MAGLSATYIDADTFTVASDLTTTFVVGRRVKADCGIDGYKFGTISASSFGGGVTTVDLTAASDNLTSNLDVVWYGIVGGGATDQSIPIHSHDGSEGSGGEVTSLIKQIVMQNVTTVIQTSTSIPKVVTPTVTSGDAWFSQEITLTDSTNSVRIQINVPFDTSQDGDGVVVLVHNGISVLSVVAGHIGKKQKSGSAVYVDFYDTPGTVGPIKYFFRVGRQAAGTTDINRTNIDATPWGGTFLTNSCNLTLTEIDLT